MSSQVIAIAEADLTQPERQKVLLERINLDGRVIAARVATELRVSEDTIRRDLRELADAGLVQRFHGGAIRRATVAHGFVERLSSDAPAKSALAERALPLIRPGMVVLIDQSTTLLALARLLSRVVDITVVTPAPDIALAALDSGVRDVVQIGGKIDSATRSASGAAALEAIGRLRPDICFLGICALDAVAGITAIDHDDSHLKRAMLMASAKVVALVTADKIGTTSPYKVGNLSDLDCLIAPAGVPEALVQTCRAAGVEVDLA